MGAAWGPAGYHGVSRKTRGVGMHKCAGVRRHMHRLTSGRRNDPTACPPPWPTHYPAVHCQTDQVAYNSLNSLARPQQFINPEQFLQDHWPLHLVSAYIGKYGIQHQRKSEHDHIILEGELTFATGPPEGRGQPGQVR